jgi:Uma2 family endonuclease
MAYAQPRAWTIPDFLTFESGESERYELVGGVVRLRTGDTAAHSAIKGNVALAFRDALRGAPWRPYICGLRVLTPTAVLYPDVLVAGRPLAPDDDRLSDPTVVVEMLSPASETFDRIYKWREYQTIAALRHFVLIAQNERRVEVYTREQSGWQLAVIEPPEDTVVLQAIGANLSLEAIYEDSGR